MITLIVQAIVVRTPSDVRYLAQCDRRVHDWDEITTFKVALEAFVEGFPFGEIDPFNLESSVEYERLIKEYAHVMEYELTRAVARLERGQRK